MVLIRLGAMVCGYTRVAVAVAKRFAKNKIKIQYQTLCLQYLHMANISDGDKDISIIQALSVVKFSFLFYFRLPRNITVFQDMYFIKLVFIKGSE